MWLHYWFTQNTRVSHVFTRSATLTRRLHLMVLQSTLLLREKTVTGLNNTYSASRRGKNIHTNVQETSYSLCPSNFRIIIPKNVFCGATWPLRTGMVPNLVALSDSAQGRPSGRLASSTASHCQRGFSSSLVSHPPRIYLSFVLPPPI